MNDKYFNIYGIFILIVTAFLLGYYGYWYLQIVPAIIIGYFIARLETARNITMSTSNMVEYRKACT